MTNKKADQKARQQQLEAERKRLWETGRRWADGEPVKAPSHVLHTLTDGRQGEKPPRKDFYKTWVASESIAAGAAERLAELYLEETGLEAKRAVDAARAEAGETLLDLDLLTEQERTKLDQAASQLVVLAQLVTPLSLTHLVEEDLTAVGLGDADLKEARSLEDREDLDDVPLPNLHLELSAGKKAQATYDRLSKKAAASEGTRNEWLAELLTGQDGKRHPALSAWLRDRRKEGFLFRVQAHLERLARQEAEQRAEEAEQRAEEAEQRAAELEATAAVAPLLELGDRTLMVRPIVDALRDSPRQLHQKLRRIEQGSLFPLGDTLQALEETEATVTGRQLSHLNASQVRALCGTLRAMSSPGDDGQTFRYDGLRLSFDLFCQAAEVNTKHTKAKRDLIHGLDSLSREEVFASLTFSENGKRKMWGGRTRIVSAILEWEDNQEAGRLWANRKPGEPWDGPLPSAVILGLPPMMRYVFNALCLRGDVLARLDAGAKKLRGKLLPLDFALFLEIAQTQQQRSKGTDGQPLSYVNRDTFILEHFGERRIQQDKAKGRYSKRRGAEGQYLHSAGVLIEAELIHPEWSPQQDTRSGVRDVFALVPGVLLHRPKGSPPQEELLAAANQVGGGEKSA